MTCIICETPATRADDDSIAVAPDVPCGLADVWLAPAGHHTAGGEARSAALARAHALLLGLFRSWHHHLGCRGANLMGYLGDKRPDWPEHPCFRLLGRSRVEMAHPIRVLNGGAQPPTIAPSELASAAMPVAGLIPEVDRWNLRDPDRECDCCNDHAVNGQQIGTDGVVRLLQPRRGSGPGILLVSPVRHVERLAEVSREEFEALLRAAEAADEMFTATLGTAGTYFFLNDGPVAGQETPHVHMHLHGRMSAQPANPFAVGSSIGVPSQPATRLPAELRADAAAWFDGRSWP